MEGLGLTWFDGVAIVILAFSGVMAFARGLIREVFSIVAFIGAAIAAIYLSERLRPLVEQLSPLRGSLATLGAGLVIFLAVFVVITIVTSMVARRAHDSPEIGGFDRLGGAIFGVLRGVLVVALFVLLMRQTTDDEGMVRNQTIPAPIVNARTYPMFEAVAIGLERLLPQARARARDYIDERRQGDSAPAAEPAAEPAEPEAAPPPTEG